MLVLLLSGTATNVLAQKKSVVPAYGGQATTARAMEFARAGKKGINGRDLPEVNDAFLTFVPTVGAPSNGGIAQVGDRFVLELWLNAASHPDTEGQQSYLTFTYQLIQNVDASLILTSCVAAQAVTADTTVFDAVLQNEVCNGPSSCNFRGTINPPGNFAYVSGAFNNCPTGCGGLFRVARIGLCATAPGQARLHWQFSPPDPINRDSEIVDSSYLQVQNRALFADYTFTVVSVLPTSTSTPSPTPTRTYTSTPTPVPTNTATSTNTATPTFTYTPSDTPTDVPTSTSTDTPTSTPTDTPVDTATSTLVPTSTYTETPTSTPTGTATPTPVLVGHVTWQGRPVQPHALQQLPITLTLKMDSTEVNYPTTTTDASGFFTASLSSLPAGTYSWRVKGPKYLANSGTVTITGGSVTSVEMGLMLTGDANNDNVVDSRDFILLKRAFGTTSGDPGYDDRVDFTGDLTVNSVDFNLLKRNFGVGGALPLGPVGFASP